LITQITLRDFRSYEAFELQPHSELTIVVGPNATGKTNVVEAVELLTSANSFRRPNWADCVRWERPEAKLSLVAAGDGRHLDTELSISAQGRRAYRVNGTPKRRLSEVTGILPSVVFTPDDLRMVKGSADRRRAAIDGVGDQLSPAYQAARGEYERVLRQRNTLLRERSGETEEMAVWTERLVVSGERFSSHRRRLFERIEPLFRKTYSSLAEGERVEARYVASWDRPEAGPGSTGVATMEQELLRRKHEEHARGTTLVGPHRDEVVFSVNGREARNFASQGQQRTIALAWKLSEVGVIDEIAGQPPVLLLDDVMSELDGDRRHALASFVGEAAQTIITTTNLGYFDPSLIERALLVTLR
jgi:DNA replication and repair protein RecF